MFELPSSLMTSIRQKDVFCDWFAHTGPMRPRVPSSRAVRISKVATACMCQWLCCGWKTNSLTAWSTTMLPLASETSWKPVVTFV